MPVNVEFIHHLFNFSVLYAVKASAIAEVSKYHITDRDSGINVGRLPLVAAAKKKLFGTFYIYGGLARISNDTYQSNKLISTVSSIDLHL